MSTKLTFGDIHDISLKLKNTGDTNLVENLYFLLYGEQPKVKAVKRRITAFSGYPFQENSEEFEKNLSIISESLSIKNLQKLCDFFSQKFIKTASAHELANILISNIYKLLGNENSYQSREYNGTKSVPKSVNCRSSRKKSIKSFESRDNKMLLDIQMEIDRIQEDILKKKEEIINIQCDIEDFKNDEETPAQTLKIKENELGKKTKLLAIQEDRLKNKEKSFNKYEEILEKTNRCDTTDIASEEDEEDFNDVGWSVPNRVQEWANSVNNHNACFENDGIETLTRSINKMLTRQTIGSQLTEFDGTSCLKWPIFYAQYILSDEACNFSPKENVLRLNKSLKGEARKMVEMLLITVKQPDEIIDILKKKYGRPEHIMDELLAKAHETPNVESLDSFLNFSITIRNIVEVVEGDIAKIIDQRYLLATFVNKLPPHLLTQWGNFLIEKKIKDHHESLKDFSDWIQEMSEAVSRITFISKNTGNHPSTSNECERKYLNITHNSTPKPASKICKLCTKGEHPLEKCQQFQNLDVQQRWKIIKKHNACFCCLRYHNGKCKKGKACGINNCERFHNNLLHKNKENSSNTLQRSCEANTCVNEVTCNVLLKMLPAKIRGPNGILNITALLDEGSTVTLIDSSVASKLGLTGPVSPLCCKWTGEIYRYDEHSQVVQAEISGVNSISYHSLKNIRTIHNLELPFQKYDLQKVLKKYPFVKQFASEIGIEENPTLLIGQNNAHLILSRNILQPHPNGPILSKTKIGWTLHGTVENLQGDLKNEVAVVCCEEADDSLHNLVKSFMKIENFGVVSIRDKRKSKEDENAISSAQNSIKFNGTGYEIKLPRKSDIEDIPESKQMAFRRLMCLERRLRKERDLGEAYSAEIKKLFEKNYAVPVQDFELRKQKNIWFLPHFPVTNPNKPGKVRIVFDAAARSNGFSLNDFLLTGPDLLTSLFGVLLRFRTHKIAFAGDIREMFNRVKIAEEDSFFQCFLWRNLESNEAPKVYRMTAMLFGTTCSPFLAQFVKNYNAEEHRAENPRAADAIIYSHYVDHYLDSTESEEEAIQLVNDVIRIHGKGGFEIRNFISNSSVLLNNIPKQLIADNKLSTEVDKNSNPERILGMMWNPCNDCFTFKLKFHKIPKEISDGVKIPTKRQVLKTAMSVYDPIGMLSPIIIKVKILLQKIWRAGLGWDDSITDNMFKKWLVWLKQLEKVREIEIPRCYSFHLQKAETIELHTFSDSSEDAYASAVYLHLKYEEGDEVVLVTSKARVSPLKSLSIPKLELLAAVMGVRLSMEALKYLNFNISKKFYWTDSRTVLHWINSDKKLQTYVSARVGEILEHTEVEQWRWVPTSENVADDCTRETTKDEIHANHRWFKGPAFLYENQDRWPRVINAEKIDINLHEVEDTKNCISEVLPDIRDHYTWIKLLRITARIHQFIMLLKKQKRSSFLVCEQMAWSEKLWWKSVQCSKFPKDIKNLREKKSNRDGRLHRMSIFLDTDGIMRVCSRILRMDNIPAEIDKESVVLDGDHEYTQKMIMHFHKKNGHQGIETIINDLRRKFWIPKIRTIVKRVIKSCQFCRKRVAKSAGPIMSQLPQERLLKYEKPFSATGLDFFGPYSVRIGRRIEKRYGVLFTCMTVRAIHVEIAHSLNTDSCIMAIRRFLSRRGSVKVIWSDNGTNIRGASRELLEAFDQLEMSSVVDELTNRGIYFKRIPPLSPFMGGCWERLIGCFKRTLNAILRDRNPTDEVLQTVFSEAEYIVNSRPLTHVSENPQDPVSICPNDILLGKSSEIMTPGLFTDRDLITKKQWRISQYLADLFWRRWLKEYLPTLINRTKWNGNEPNIRIGEIVVINENNVPRGMWPMGVIEKVYKGEDGVVRVAEVRTAQGTFKRPARKLHRLHISIDERRVNTGEDNVGMNAQ